MSQEAPVCPYCGAAAVLKTSKEFYRTVTDYGWLWVCPTPKCDARVGCHKGTTTPLGRLADRKLRVAKERAHAAFDRLWKAKAARGDCAKQQARGLGYGWLAQQLGLAPEACHIGMFDLDTCERVVAVCKPYHNARRRML